jgi:hypothetical protein
MKRFIFLLLLIPILSFSQAGKFHGQTYAIDADAGTYISAWQTASSSTMQGYIKNAFNTFVLSLKANNFWTKFATGDIAPVYGATAATAVICIKGTTLTLIASPTVSDQGILWNATTQYAKTGWIPSTSAGTTNVHVSYWSGSNLVNSDRVSIGAFDGTNYLGITITTTPGNILGRAYSTTVTLSAATPSDKRGFFLVSKESNTSLFWQQNGSTIITNTNSNTAARPTRELYIGAVNSSGSPANFDAKTCKYASWGDLFSATDGTTYYNIVAALIKEEGR